MDKSLIDFFASLRLLRTNIDLFYRGLFDAYRSVALELRKLLCENNALLSRLFIEIKLHQLHSANLFQNHPNLLEGLVHFMPGRLGLENGSYKFALLFSQDCTQLTMTDWLDQPFFSEKITVRELIKSVADKESAHSDPSYNDTLIHTKSVVYGSFECHILAVIAIGEYILKFLDKEKEKLHLKPEYQPLTENL